MTSIVAPPTRWRDTVAAQSTLCSAAGSPRGAAKNPAIAGGAYSGTESQGRANHCSGRLNVFTASESMSASRTAPSAESKE